MNREKILIFVSLTILISWTAAGLFYLLDLEWGTPFSLVFAIADEGTFHLSSLAALSIIVFPIHGTRFYC